MEKVVEVPQVITKDSFSKVSFNPKLRSAFFGPLSHDLSHFRTAFHRNL